MVSHTLILKYHSYCSRVVFSCGWHSQFDLPKYFSVTLSALASSHKEYRKYITTTNSINKNNTETHTQKLADIFMVHIAVLYTEMPVSIIVYFWDPLDDDNPQCEWYAYFIIQRSSYRCDSFCRRIVHPMNYVHASRYVGHIITTIS